MSQLNDRLSQDLKQAMIAGDKRLVSVLKGLKNALQYASVAKSESSELTDEEGLKVLQKESKKRSDAIVLYRQAGDSRRAEDEEYEKKVIDKYLPEPLSKEGVLNLVEEVINQLGDTEQKNIGKVISEVQRKSKGRAEGALVAALVKERLAK